MAATDEFPAKKVARWAGRLLKADPQQVCWESLKSKRFFWKLQDSLALMEIEVLEEKA
jgi:hypothetical protein